VSQKVLIGVDGERHHLHNGAPKEKPNGRGATSRPGKRGNSSTSKRTTQESVAQKKTPELLRLRRGTGGPVICGVKRSSSGEYVYGAGVKAAQPGSFGDEDDAAQMSWKKGKIVKLVGTTSERDRTETTQRREKQLGVLGGGKLAQFSPVGGGRARNSLSPSRGRRDSRSRDYRGWWTQRNQLLIEKNTGRKEGEN